MHSGISTAITNLEQAASTEEMANAAKQIANLGITDFTHDQLNRLISALSAATRCATDAASVVAWAGVAALACTGEKQAGALATVAIVAFVQLAPHAATPESVQVLTNAIGNITNAATQTTKDAFATPAIVAAFMTLAPHATTPESVGQLTNAIGNITHGTTQATKDAFAIPAIVDAFVQLAPHATTPESVQGLTRAIANITSGKMPARKDAFATPQVVHVFVKLTPHARTPESVGQLTCAIGNITHGATQATKDAFATPAIVDAFVQLAPRATTPESVERLTMAITNTTSGTTQATKDAFATPAIVGVFVQLAARATTPESVQHLTDPIVNITHGTTQATKGAFAIPAIVGAFVQLARHAKTPESVQHLTWAIGNITAGTTQAIKDAFATPEIVAAFVQLAPHATTPKSVHRLTTAIANITSGTTQATKDAFSVPAIVGALRSLFSFASTATSRSALGAAFAAVSHPDAPAAVPVVVPGYAVDHSGIDCILKQALIVFPPNYRPPCNARDAIERCGVSGVTNLPLVAREASSMAANRLANLPPVAAGGPCRLELNFAIAIAAYTYDLGCSSADPSGAGSDNFCCCLNAALRQRAQGGTGLLQLKPILCYLFRGLEALPAAVNVVVYRGVPSSSSALVREKYEAGKDVYWTSFTSASEKFATAVEFASKEGPGGVIFRIKSLTGRYVHWYSSMSREGEVVFSPNSSFTVSEGPHDEVLNGRTMCVVCLIERRQESVVY